MKNNSNHLNILILEDDIDQMELLSDFAVSEIRALLDDENTNDEQRKILEQIQIIKVNDIKSLQKAVLLHKDILLAVLDCNTPDAKGEAAHDQLVKTNHVITGQHKSVDIVIEHSRDTSITMISSLDRFRTIINRYYESSHDLSINFIRKNAALKIKKNIEYHLRQHLKTLD